MPRGSSEVLPPRAGGSGKVLSSDPPNAEASPDAFAYLITPAEQRFVRCHFPVPRLGDEHAVQVHGAVLEPRSISLADLRGLPAVTETVVTECAGNGRTRLSPPVPGEQWTGGAVSVAQWTGVPLRELLRLRDSAVEVVFTGADGGRFRRSLPVDAALDPATLLAYEMNGARIPARFGGPLRLVVPGWYGMASVKWVQRIEAVEAPFEGEFQTQKYVYAPGIPVTRVRVKSMFTGLPGEIAVRDTLRITGLAWGGEGVARVEVAVDGEWSDARLVGPRLPYAWRRFELLWAPPRRGTWQLSCRATDHAGVMQPEQPVWNALGYGVNPIEHATLVVT